MDVKERYAERDIEAIGDLYAAHVEAMTREGLHEKSDIAAELAWRDATLLEAESALAAANADAAALATALDDVLSVTDAGRTRLGRMWDAARSAYAAHTARLATSPPAPASDAVAEAAELLRDVVPDGGLMGLTWSGTDNERWSGRWMDDRKAWLAKWGQR